jgi:hypothetical protein
MMLPSGKGAITTSVFVGPRATSWSVPSPPAAMTTM